MSETIKNKVQHSTAVMFRENLEVMVQFGIISGRQKEFLERIMSDFKYGKKIIEYDSLDVFFRYDSDLFDKKLLDLVGNPERYSC